MSGVDYSKWAKMANEISDSDDEGEGPSVTTFDQPQSVTFGGGANDLEARSLQGIDRHSDHDISAPASADALRGNADMVVAQPSTHAGARMSRFNDEQLTENGGCVSHENRVTYVWRQNRAEVVVVVPAPPKCRATDVKVSLMTKPTTVTEGVADLIRVEWKEQQVLLEGELAFQVEHNVDAGVDWELRDFPGTDVARDRGLRDSLTEANVDRRGVEITLRKHCAIPEVTIWWKSFLKGGPEIDVTRIHGRAKNNQQSVWEEAMDMFKDKMAARRERGRIPVDTGEF